MQGLEEKIVGLLKSYNIPYAPAGTDKHVRQGWVGIHCPFCPANDTKWHMGISTSYLNCHCWSCGGHSFYSTMKAVGVKHDDIKTVIDGTFIVKTRFDNKKVGRYKPPLGVTDRLIKEHYEYLTKTRNIEIKNREEFDALWGLKSIGLEGGPYKFRIFMPIMIGHVPVSFTTRRIVRGGNRYLSANATDETIPHKTLLYGEDHVRSSILVVEGPLDAIRVGPGAVATFGTEFTTPQVNRIARYPKRFICFDNQPTAQRRAEALCRLLEVCPGKTYLVKINAKDPGEANKNELERLRSLLYS